MNPQRADALFLCPLPITRVKVLGRLEEWSVAVAQIGVNGDAASPEVAITQPDRIEEAIATGASAVIVEGGDVARELRQRGLEARSYLALPDVHRPQLFVPIGSHVTRYALSEWLPGWERWKVARNRLAGALAEKGLLPDAGRVVTIGAEASVRPFLVAAAEDFGVGPGADWFLATGHGDILARGAFLIFPPGAATPGWALKFCRVPGADGRIERDARALRLASAAGSAAARAPRFIGRLESGRYQASLETAASGRRLNGVLSILRPARTKRRAIEDVVQWLTELACDTAADPKLLEPERRRLREDVLPRWSELGAPADLVERVPPVRPVLQHNDLGTWNLVTDGKDFTVLDWESAKPHGFPLWDALYFLADALASLDEARDRQGRREHFRRLFLGELASSDLLRMSLEQVAHASDVPFVAVGPIATLCWLHHAGSHAARREAARRLQHDAADPGWMFEEMAQLWLTTQGLGSDWNLPGASKRGISR